MLVDDLSGGVEHEEEVLVGESDAVQLGCLLGGETGLQQRTRRDGDGGGGVDRLRRPLRHLLHEGFCEPGQASQLVVGQLRGAHGGQHGSEEDRQCQQRRPEGREQLGEDPVAGSDPQPATEGHGARDGQPVADDGFEGGSGMAETQQDHAERGPEVGPAGPEHAHGHEEAGTGREPRRRLGHHRDQQRQAAIVVTRGAGTDGEPGQPTDVQPCPQGGITDERAGHHVAGGVHQGAEDADHPPGPHRLPVARVDRAAGQDAFGDREAQAHRSGDRQQGGRQMQR